MPVDLAIKELIGEELASLRELHTKQEERCAALEKAVEDLSGKLEERAREAEALREEATKHREASDALEERTKAIEALDPSALAERVGRLESDADGAGGLEQVRERLESAANELRDFRPRLDECGRIAGAAKSRTDDFDVLLKKFGRECEDLQGAMNKSLERLESVDSSSRALGLAQQALEDAVAGKYDKLWQDVLHELEEFRMRMLEEQRADLARRQDGAKTQAKNVVSYALNVLGSAHSERRNLALSRDLVVAWREQAWASARRRMGLFRLRCLAQRRQRATMARWSRSTAIARLAADLHEATSPGELTRLGDAVSQLQRQDEEFSGRCGSLEASLAGIKGEMCTAERLESRLTAQAEEAQQRLVATERSLEERLQATAAAASEAADEVRAGARRELEDLGGRLSQQEKNAVDVSGALEECAKAKELQTMMRDTLLMWNSIKQLDVAKADKKDLDALATEGSGRERLSTKRLEDFEAGVTAQVREEALKAQDRWSDLEERVAENAKQFRHWEQMWEKLTGFVEDLVGKLSGPNAALPDGTTAAKPSLAATLRPNGSRASSRDASSLEPAAARSRARSDVPPLPAQLPPSGHFERSGMADSEAPTVLQGLARGLAHQASSDHIDSGRSSKGAFWASSSRPAARPKSASGARRPHDRGRC